MNEREAHITPRSHDFLKSILEYQYLEQKVRGLILRVCRPFCSTCSECCCKEDFCFESVDSFWLRMIRNRQGYTASQYNASKGWLSSDGCRLVIGRPPVCYEYLCDRILAEISGGNSLDKVKAISALPSLAGKNALGKKHLVTLSSEQILRRVNFKKLRRQIAKSFNFFQHYHIEILPYLPSE